MPIERQSIPGIGTWVTTKHSFSTDDTTVEWPTDSIGLVAPVHSQIVGLSTIDAGDNPLLVAETLRSDGLVETSATQSITIERSTNGTLGLTLLSTYIATGNNRHFITGYGILFRSRYEFSGMNTTVEVDCGGLEKVRILGIHNVSTATYDARDNIIIDEAVSSDGIVTVPSTGTITIIRSANGASGLTGVIHMTDGDTARIPGMGTIFSSFVNFSGTDETVEVPCKGYPRVLAFSTVVYSTPVGTFDEIDQNLSIEETTDAKGVIEVDTDNDITVRRASGGTSGMALSVNMIGY